MIKFKFFSGDVDWHTYGGIFLSQKQNNGEFDFWFAIRAENWANLVGEEEATQKYCVSLLSVSIQEAEGEGLQQALECCGMDEEEEDITEEMKIYALLSHGTYANLWEGNGNNINKLMKKARNQANLASMLYGFYMDKQQNAIGNTGWDFQKGKVGF
jgi:hypothetical protein